MNFRDIRIGVIGNVDAGKSTLVGAFTSGKLDDGNGLTRSMVCVHKHELQSGRTSCASHQIMGYKNHEPVYNTVSVMDNSKAKTESWKHICENSDTVVTFIDLAGHRKHLNTTAQGISGQQLDSVMVIIDSTQSNVPQMTREHIVLAMAMHIPIILIYSKVDRQVNKSNFENLKKDIRRSFGKQKLFYLSSASDVLKFQDFKDFVPMFSVSSVSGKGMDVLHSWVSRIQTQKTVSEYKSDEKNQNEVEFQIDSTFNVPGFGTVLSGILYRGKVTVGQELLLGPFHNGIYRRIGIRSIHVKRCHVKEVEAKDNPVSACFWFRCLDKHVYLQRQHIHKGMYVTTVQNHCWYFKAKISILHHSTSIKEGYQSILHTELIAKPVVLVSVIETSRESKEQEPLLRSQDIATCIFRFVHQPQIVHVGKTLIAREGSTRIEGMILQTQFTENEILSMHEKASRFRQFRFLRQML